MNSSTFATSYCASPALATLYAPPRTRVAQVIETVPGWRGFGHVQRIAIVANAVLLVLLAGLMTLFMSGSHTGATLVLWIAALCAMPLVNLLGLWPYRTCRPLRTLMLVVNLAWFGAVLWFTVMMFITVGASYLIEVETRVLGADDVKILGVIFLIGLLPPGTALWTQLQGWLRG